MSDGRGERSAQHRERAVSAVSNHEEQCFDAEDTRIRCTACHDPHDALSHEAALRQSLRIVSHRRRRRRGGRENMSGRQSRLRILPHAQVHAAEIALQFADHNIRVVRPNEPYPK
jgi:hypothetical protein